MQFCHWGGGGVVWQPVVAMALLSLFVYISLFSVPTGTGSPIKKSRHVNIRNDAHISERCSELGITPEVLAKSRIVGNTDRWHQVIQKMKESSTDTNNNENCSHNNAVKVAILGGSVPAGAQCSDAHGLPFSGCEWPAQLNVMMKQHFGNNDCTNNSNIEVVNLAHPATPSTSGLTQVMSLQEYDAIIIQWTANDDNLEKYFGGDAKSIKPMFESLVRTALSLERRPAVIIFESMGTSYVDLLLRM